MNPFNPNKPLLIYDGDCGFCKHWIFLWKGWTGSSMDYAPSQEVGAQYPQVPTEKYAVSVVLVLPSGRVYYGAEAVLRSLEKVQRFRWVVASLLFLYRAVPGVSHILEWCYSLVARNRSFFSKLIRFHEKDPHSFDK